MQFAEPSDTLFRTAFQGVDVVHIYMPFKFGRRAAKVAHQMGIPVTAGFHHAAGERAVFGRPATSHSRYFQLPVLAVQALAVQAH